MKKILIINANYYKDISDNLLKGAFSVLKKNKINTSLVYAPGVFEIPFTIKKFVKKYDAFISLGCVIKGETPHFDLICKCTFDAIMKIAIENNKPISNGIITALSKQQAIERSSLKSNFVTKNKGSEAAKAIIAVLKNEPKKI